MTKERLKDLVAKKIYGQGNQVDTGSHLSKILNGIIDLIVGADIIGKLSDLATETKTSIVAAINEVLGKIPSGELIPTVTISALESAELTAEQAAAAGFTPEVIAMLQAAHKPTVEFSDMCVSFTNVEVISEDLVNQSTIIVYTGTGGGKLYKSILSLYTDGRILYTVAEVE